MIKALHNLHPPFSMILGGSLCEDLGFFHSFKTSPRSSKSESGCKSYACFSFGISAVFVLAGCPGFAPDVRAARRISGPMSGSLLSREHFCADIYSGCPGSLPDVRGLKVGRMSGPSPDNRAPCFPYYAVFCVWFSFSRRMSGPCPDVRPVSATYTTTVIFALPLYISLYPSGRGLTTPSKTPQEH